MPEYIVTLRLPNGKKTKTQHVLANNQFAAMFKAENIGKNRFYEAVKAEEVKRSQA